MRHLRLGIWIVACLACSGPAHAQTIGWQEAVARLAHERTRAETCVQILKRHGDEAAVSRGELAYGDAKAEIDAVIAGLVVALAKDDEPASLPELEARLQRGVMGREGLCAQVTPLVPPAASATRSLIIDLAVAALPALLQAVPALLEYVKGDPLVRQTIQTQLEATTWPAFAAITP